MSKWQPIETAPKGGQFVLLYYGKKYYVMQGRYFARRWIASIDCRLEPTHWMPLPEPPSE